MGIFNHSKKTSNISLSVDHEIEDLIDTYGNDILRIAYMYLKDSEKAEDAFQEVFLKAYKNLKSFRGESSKKTWLISITMNVCKDYLKSAWHTKVTCKDKDILNDKVSKIDTENEAIHSIQHKELLDKIMELPIKYKEIILLFYYQQMETNEISKILSIPEGTVRSRLFRARKLLKDNIEMEAFI